MISAIVINWNGAERLPGCLDPLMAQVPPPDEIILVDNHSEDGSRDLVAERYPGVRIVDTGGNFGPAHARNVGVEEARYPLCLLIDNDVEMLPGALAEMREVLEADARTALVQARSFCGDDPEVLHYDHADLHLLGLLTLTNWFEPRSSARDPVGPVGAFIALCVLVRRESYQHVGGFFAPFFILFEDNELAYRLRAAGWSLRLAVGARVLHHAGTAGLSVRGADAPYPARRTFLHARNRWLFLSASMRPVTFWLTMPVQLLYDGVHLGFSCVRGPAHVWAWLSGHFAALTMWGVARRRRRSLSRSVPDASLFVGEGGLTPNPGLAEGRLRSVVRGFVNTSVRLHWKLVRRFCG